MVKKLIRPAGQLIVAAVIGGAMPSVDVAALLPDARRGERAPAAPIELLTAPQNLRSGYRLPVAEVPAPPADVIAQDAPVRSRWRGCPVELRAVVSGLDGGFAVVSVPGDDDSILVAVGDELATPRGRARVEAIQSRRLTLEVGGATVACEVGASSGSTESESKTELERHEVPPL